MQLSVHHSNSVLSSKFNYIILLSRFVLFIKISNNTMEEIDLIVLASSLFSERCCLRVSQLSWMAEVHRSWREGSPAEGDPRIAFKSVFSVAKSLIAATGPTVGTKDASVSDRNISGVRVIRVAFETQLATIRLSRTELHLGVS
mmetsp:Transcript_25006/g.59018  ORF Transcript_25006/g.59018 Transcript_25006/m.59018 type:complete len:144 (+) Transcript_25006:193-624(+)